MVASARGLDAADPGWSLAEAGTGDELDDLGRAFNDLLARLHVAYERQRRFSGDASHQLRTPLTVLIGQLEVALRHERSGEEYRRVLSSALGRAVQLGADRRGAAVPQPRRGRRRAARRRADRTARLGRRTPGGPAGGRARGPRSSTAPAGRSPLDQGPPALLGQLLDNLLDNAAKHGTRARRSSSRRPRAGGAVLAVEDRGPGIAAGGPAAHLRAVLPLGPARRRGVAGVGLGLAVVRRIATACGGSVAVHSEPGRGRGSRSASRWRTAPG